MTAPNVGDDERRQAKAESGRQWRLRNAGALPDDDRRHGTTNGYLSYRCRCDRCRQAVADDRRARIERARANPIPADDERHGRWSTYSNFGCRCARCRQAATDYLRGKRAEWRDRATNSPPD